ncbi:MAG: hypothetical protein AAGF71_09120 [Pseudomonadota bacterium]
MAQPEPSAPWKSWLLWGLAALGGLGVLAVVGVILWMGLSGGPIQMFERMQTARDWSAGDNGDASAVPGFLSIEPPQVYTRERLVNDRFREATWLNLQLEDTDTAAERDLFSRASSAQNRASQVTGTIDMADGTGGSATAPTVDSAGATQLDELEVFQRRTVYRERLRNDLMDTLLDDGHDLDGNTLYRLNFDAVVMPWADRRQSPGTAVFVVTARSPYAAMGLDIDEDADLGSLDPYGIKRRAIADDVDLLRSWQREIQIFLSEVLSLRQEALSRGGTLENPVDPKENLAFDWFLRTRLIETYLRVAAKLGTSQDCALESNRGNPFCTLWTPLPPAEPIPLASRMDAIARASLMSWRSSRKSPDLASPMVLESMLESLNVAKSVNDMRALSRPVIVPSNTPPPEAGGPPNRSLRFNSQTFFATNDPELKRAMIRVIAALEAVEMAMLDFQRPVNGNPPSVPIDITLGQSALERQVNLGSYLGQFRGIVPNHDQLMDFHVDLEKDKASVLQDERLLASDPNVPLPPREVQRPHQICLSESRDVGEDIFAYASCMFMRATTDRLTRQLLAEFLQARLSGGLNEYEEIEQPITGFLDVQLSGCELSGCSIEVRPYTGITNEMVGLTPLSRTFEDGSTRTVSAFDFLPPGAAFDSPYGSQTVKMSPRNLDALIDGMRSFGPKREDALTCLSLARDSLSLEINIPPEDVYVSCMLRQWMETRRSDLTVYGVSPRIAGTVRQGSTAASAALGATGQVGSSGPGLNATAGESRATAGTEVTASVIGFSQMPLDGPGTVPDFETKSEAVFGWAIRPTQSLDGTHWLPSHNRLSAVVAVPSWWRWLDFEIHACWVTPQNAREMAATLQADPRHICKSPTEIEAESDDQTSPMQRADLPPILDRKFQVQLPRRVEDVTERFNFDFIKSPYFDRDWDTDTRNNPNMLTLEVGRPGRLVLAGERLWRGTVVTVNNQAADRIVVLPDMKGVVAEFNCLHPPPGSKHVIDRTTTAQTAPSPVRAPMLVWTSEGRTQVRQVTLQPFIERTPGDVPCSGAASYAPRPGTENAAASE